MDSEFWQQKWARREINFHRLEINALLQAHGQRLAGFERVYVPLCGKSLDMVHLRDAGHIVFGTEIVGTAVEEFFQEQGLQPEITKTPTYSHYAGANIRLLLGDAFALTPDDLGGPIDAVYDRASLVAVDPATRQRFVDSIFRVLRKNGAMLLVVFEYDQSKLSGPPWSVSDADVTNLFREFGSVTKLETQSAFVSTRFTEAGITELRETAYWIVK
jgi:thiopurine S-methyltransferase